MNQVNVNSQSMLAKLLATENITVQYKNGAKTAMFDLKNRVLILPVWENISEDLRHLLIGHETGHALDTPEAKTYIAAAEKISKNVFGKDKVSERLMKTVRGFLNVIEDARIDKRQKRRYPGLRKNYINGYKELVERDFFGTANRDVNSMNFIDKANLYFKGGMGRTDIEFSPVERSFLKRIENLETFDETVTITEEIYRYCKGKLENPDQEDLLFVLQEMEDNKGDFDDWEEGEFDDGFELDSDDADSSDGDESDEGEEGTEADSGEEQEEGGNVGTKAGRGAGSGGDITEHAPESETDRVWEEKVQSLSKDDNVDYIYVNMPDVNWKEAIHGYKRVMADWRNEISKGPHSYNQWSYRNTMDKDILEGFRKDMAEWKTKEKDAISFLVKEFEQRKSAEIYSRISTAKTGVIDTNKLHSYRYNDDIFRRLSVIPEGKNHGFVMIIDWSGSMDHCLKYTIRQLFTLVLFCRQIQVPFEVYLFKDSNNTGVPWIPSNKENVLRLGPVVLREVLSSKMNTAELNEAMSVLWAIGNGGLLTCEALGGTPLNEAIILAPKVVNDFRKKHKLEIVNTIFLTDGESNAINGLLNDKSRSNPNSNPYGIRRDRKYFYNDPETGKTYDILPYGGWGESGIQNTSNFLRILKDKTQSNLIGFYLWSDGWHRFLHRFNLHGDSSFQKKVTKFWKDNKFYPVKSEGYDDYYIIDTRALKDEANVLEIDNKKTTRVMAKAFTKFTAKKTVNRVLLRQFITHVTGQAKKSA